VPVNKRHLDMVATHLRYSDKAFMGSVTAPSRAADSIEMARIVFGRDFVDNNCVILGNVNVNSPLVWDATMTGALKTYAAANQAPVVVPFILGGAMGPVTNAGAIAQAHAETLVGVALAQLVRPGCPVIYGNFLSSMALRSGSPTFGTPEPAIGSLVVGQLARRVGLPLRCSGAFTSSKLPDGQAMSESAVSMQAALLCGTNFILHSAGWLEGGLTMGYEKFMMDLDLCGAAHTYLAGISLDDDQFALDGFREVGPGRHFFAAQHTLRHYETAFYEPALSDSNSFEQWRDAGSFTTEQRAAQAVRDSLGNYERPAMDDAIDAELTEFIHRRKASMPDAWY
jgi:trimethylamine---corrinoid protein Co-methyltransferase